MLHRSTVLKRCSEDCFFFIGLIDTRMRTVLLRVFSTKFNQAYFLENGNHSWSLEEIRPVPVVASKEQQLMQSSRSSQPVSLLVAIRIGCGHAAGKRGRDAGRCAQANFMLLRCECTNEACNKLLLLQLIRIRGRAIQCQSLCDMK